MAEFICNVFVFMLGLTLTTGLFGWLFEILRYSIRGGK